MLDFCRCRTFAAPATRAPHAARRRASCPCRRRRQDMRSQRSLLEPGGMPQAAPQAPAGGDYERGRLAVEIPLSTHHFTAWPCFCICFKIVLLAVVLLVVSQVAL